MSYHTKDLVSDVYKNFQMPKAEANRIVSFILDTVVKKVSKNEKVTLRGFGRFYLYVSNPRQARNPTTGETVNVPAKRRLKFKASNRLEV